MPSRSSRIDTKTGGKTEPKEGRAEPAERPFWEVKTLPEMTRKEWESLCDRCGRCCMVKLEDEDTGEIFTTDIACKLFEEASCSCRDYPGRQAKVADCIKLTPKRVEKIPWLPRTCAYRLIAEGKPLEAWHPLVSGSFETVHTAGISVRNHVGGSEKTVKLRDYADHIVKDGD